jgi:isoleucyl-tRNA synthetase
MQVAFLLDGDPDGAQVVAWTTTPWTLPSNLSLCVHPEMIYVRVRWLLLAPLALAATIVIQNLCRAICGLPRD